MDWDETNDILEAEHTILIVDDDPVNRQVLFNLLSTERYRVIAADSGAAALKLREEHPSIDLVITDWMMPRMSGLELCRKLRENSSLSELPILMLTARGLPEDIRMGFQAGANDFLSKPVDAGELRARVRTLIEMRASVQEVIRTEMAFLQAQIKPHFLYNALNVIIATCAVNPDKATDLLIELSQYLRGASTSRTVTNWFRSRRSWSWWSPMYIWSKHGSRSVWWSVMILTQMCVFTCHRSAFNRLWRMRFVTG